jgi:hypothetical protein
VLVYLLSRPAIAADGKVGMAVVALVGAGLLLAGGLVAERMCVLPPSDDDTPGLDKIAL